MSRPKSVFIKQETLIKMLDNAKKYNSLKEAYKTMMRRKELKDYPYQSYLDRIKLLPEYRAWRNYVNKHRNDLKNNAVYYHGLGLTYAQIAEKIGVTRQHVANLLKYEAITPEIKAQRLVDDWNNNSFTGRFMTKETKKAFELLGLKPD